MSRNKSTDLAKHECPDSALLWNDVRLQENTSCIRYLPELALIFYRKVQGWRVSIDQELVAMGEPRQSRGYRAFLARWPGQVQRRMVGARGSESEAYDFASSHSSEHLVLQPALSDRPIVAATDSPIVILPGHSVRLYVVSPLWVQICQPSIDHENHHLLLEVPMHQCDDAWFGPNTLEGELSYAVKRPIVLEPPGPDPHFHSATSVVKLFNEGSEALVLERLLVPVSLMDLYRDGTGEYWTQEVIYRCEDAKDKGRLEILPNAPKIANQAQLVAKARTPYKRIGVGQAWRFLFG